jgi:hypothetical protein
MNALISSPDGGGSLTAGGVLFGYAEVRIPPPQPGQSVSNAYGIGSRCSLKAHYQDSQPGGQHSNLRVSDCRCASLTSQQVSGVPYDGQNPEVQQI